MTLISDEWICNSIAATKHVYFHLIHFMTVSIFFCCSFMRTSERKKAHD